MNLDELVLCIRFLCLWWFCWLTCENANSPLTLSECTYASHVCSKAGDLWPEPPACTQSAYLYERKNTSIVDFTPWQLMKVLQRDSCVFYVWVVSFPSCMCVYIYICTATALWINKQELAFICHSRIPLLKERSGEQRPRRWPLVCPESCHLERTCLFIFCSINHLSAIPKMSIHVLSKKWRGWRFGQIITILQQ